MSGEPEPFFSSLVKTKSASDELIKKIFALDKKAVTLTVDSLKDKAGSKMDMAGWIIKLTSQLQKSVQIMNEAIREVDISRQERSQSLKKVNELQQRLLDRDKRDESHVNIIRNAVKEKMESTMEQYSDVLKAGRPENNITLTSIRNVVKQVIDTNNIDRSKSVIIFGKQELKEENSVKVAEQILESINQKPKIMTATRFGNTQPGKIRPIRVTFNRSETVHEVIKSSKLLKTTQEFRDVYISFDKSAEERKRHNELVKSLREKITEEPNKHWYIKSNQVRCSETSMSSDSVTEIAPKPEPVYTTPEKVLLRKPPFQRPGPAAARKPRWEPIDFSDSEA